MGMEQGIELGDQWGMEMGHRRSAEIPEVAEKWIETKTVTTKNYQHQKKNNRNCANTRLLNSDHVTVSDIKKANRPASVLKKMTLGFSIHISFKMTTIADELSFNQQKY